MLRCQLPWNFSRKLKVPCADKASRFSRNWCQVWAANLSKCKNYHRRLKTSRWGNHSWWLRWVIYQIPINRRNQIRVSGRHCTRQPILNWTRVALTDWKNHQNRYHRSSTRSWTQRQSLKLKMQKNIVICQKMMAVWSRSFMWRLMTCSLRSCRVSIELLECKCCRVGRRHIWWVWLRRNASRFVMKKSLLRILLILRIGHCWILVTPLELKVNQSMGSLSKFAQKPQWRLWCR